MSSLRKAINEGQVVIGMYIAVPWLEAVEAAGYAGYDFVLIDTEHGAIDISQAAGMVLVAQGLGIAPIWRVKAAARPEIKIALDWGAAAVLVPEIRTAEDAATAVRAARYLPEGQRGVGPYRPSRFGLADTKAYIQRANEEVVVCLMIETTEAIENIEAIAAVPGIDVFNIGPCDLSNSLGVPLEFEHPDLLAAVQRVLEAARAKGITVGLAGSTPEHLQKWIPRGVTFFETVAVPDLLAQAMQQHTDSLRAVVDESS